MDETGESFSVVLEATGWRDGYEYDVDKEDD